VQTQDQTLSGWKTVQCLFSLREREAGLEVQAGSLYTGIYDLQRTDKRLHEYTGIGNPLRVP
jgi:hypothetical protein